MSYVRERGTIAEQFRRLGINPKDWENYERYRADISRTARRERYRVALKSSPRM